MSEKFALHTSQTDLKSKKDEGEEFTPPAIQTNRFLVPMLLDLMMLPMRRFRKALFARDFVGETLEIGIGTGLNFPLYRGKYRLSAIDPDLALLTKAKKRATLLGLDVRFISGFAEQLPFDDHQFDNVVITFTLCSVHDPVRVIQEIKRVLKPGGSLLFSEHIRSEHPKTAWLQDVLNPGWRRVTGFCNLNRPTSDLLAKEGFQIELLYASVHRPWTILPVVSGVARPVLSRFAG